MSLPAIEKTFNVKEQHEGFVQFIHELRYAVRDPSRQPPFASRPNLYLTRPTVSGPPVQWLLLRLVHGVDVEIVVWVRTDNLYVVGFSNTRIQGKKTVTTIWELLPDDKEEDEEKKKKNKAKKKKEEPRRPVIAGSRFLTIGSNYDDLGQPQAGPDGGSRTQPDIGWKQLVDAVSTLAAYQGSKLEIADSLRTILITFSECIRSEEICAHVGTLLEERRSGWLTARMIKIVHNWDNISACVVRSANDPDVPGRYDSLANIGLCANTDEACQAVAILNHGRPNGRPPKSWVMATAGAVDDLPEGQTFLEIFAVSVRLRNGGSPAGLYGTITIEDGLVLKELFCRDRSNPQRAGLQGGLAELTGPARAVSGYGEVVMSIGLMDAISAADIATGEAVWDTYDTQGVDYDEAEDYVLEGASGDVTLRCALITNAVVATVSIQLDGSCGKGVYGTLTAATPMFDPDTITLFNREWEDAASVEAGHAIPLLRKVAVVPLHSALRISAAMWAKASETERSPAGDRTIVAEAVFEPSFFGTVSKVIPAPGGDVTVQVIWSPN